MGNIKVRASWRNDREPLDATPPGRPWISQRWRTHQGISPGGPFGPEVGNASPDDAATTSIRLPAVQIYQVAGAQPVATCCPRPARCGVYGAP